MGKLVTDGYSSWLVVCLEIIIFLAHWRHHYWLHALLLSYSSPSSLVIWAQ